MSHPVGRRVQVSSSRAAVRCRYVLGPRYISLWPHWPWEPRCHWGDRRLACYPLSSSNLMRLPGTVSRCERRGCGISGRYIVVVRQMASALPFCLFSIRCPAEGTCATRSTSQIPSSADISHDHVRRTAELCEAFWGEPLLWCVLSPMSSARRTSN